MYLGARGDGPTRPGPRAGPEYSKINETDFGKVTESMRNVGLKVNLGKF